MKKCFCTIQHIPVAEFSFGRQICSKEFRIVERYAKSHEFKYDGYDCNYATGTIVFFRYGKLLVSEKNVPDPVDTVATPIVAHSW